MNVKSKTKKSCVVLIAGIMCVFYAFTAFAGEYYRNTMVIMNNGKVIEYYDSNIAEADFSDVIKTKVSKIYSYKHIKNTYKNKMSSLHLLDTKRSVELASEISQEIDNLKKSLIEQNLGGYTTGNSSNDNPKDNQKASEQPKTEITNVQDNSTVELEVLKHTNAYRAQNGLSALTLNDELTKAAKAHAADMAANGFLDHSSSDGRTYGDRLANFVSYEYSTAGENIACGYESGESVTNAWINSEGHRQNILNKDFSKIGIACIKSADGTPYWCQDFSN